MKKILMILLAVVTVFSLTACGGQTGDTGKKQNNNSADNGLVYTLSADGTYYEAFAPRETNENTVSITVPATYEGLPVGIPKHAFQALKNLETVVVENAVNVEAQAFISCPKLKNISISGDVDIPARCFHSLVSLETITFGEGVKSIGDNCVFSCDSVKTIIIGDDCLSIGNSAFADLATLESVTLGKGLESIGNQAFANTTSLKSIEFPTEKTLTIGDEAFLHSGLEELHIPANLVLGSFTFKFLAWFGEEDTGYSQCKGVWFYSTEPTAENLGSNSIGYTWDRTADKNAALGEFLIYVPEGCKAAYEEVMRNECDESWVRCVLNNGKLKTFVVE